jgi:hypothetical protein
MEWDCPMRPFKVAPLQAVIMFAMGLFVVGGVWGSSSEPAQAISDPIVTRSTSRTCVSGDPVADFVCRNTWLAHTRHSYR